MAKQEISKNELLELIDEQLKSGKSKKEIFRALTSQYGDQDRMAKLVALFPTEEDRKKYEILNSVLVYILLGLGLMKIVLVLSSTEQFTGLSYLFLLLLPALNILFAMEVKKMRASIYRILAVLTAMGFLRSLQHVQPDAYFLIDVFFVIVIIGLSLFLASKMFPNYGFTGPKKDAKGKYLV